MLGAGAAAGSWLALLVAGLIGAVLSVLVLFGGTNLAAHLTQPSNSVSNVGAVGYAGQ